MDEITRRFVVIDDHPVVRMAAKIVIEQVAGWRVTHEASAPSEAVGVLRQMPRDPDVVLVDLLYDGECGLELLAHLRTYHPHTRAIIYSVRADAHYAQRCLRGGAHGYLCKEDPVELIVEAARCVLRGKPFISPRIASGIAACIAAGGANGDCSEPPVASLSDREVEVFQLIGRGMATRQIAERLHRSVKTIETYRYRIKKKLGIESAIELAQIAGRHVEGNGHALTRPRLGAAR